MKVLLERVVSEKAPSQEAIQSLSNEPCPFQHLFHLYLLALFPSHLKRKIKYVDSQTQNSKAMYQLISTMPVAAGSSLEGAALYSESV